MTQLSFQAIAHYFAPPLTKETLSAAVAELLAAADDDQPHQDEPEPPVAAPTTPGDSPDDARPVTPTEPIDLACERPLTRGECAGGPRPCPWVGCRYHLLLVISRAGGASINAAVANEEPRSLEARRTSALLEQVWQENALAALERLPETCALDVADRGDHTLDEVGALLGVTRERVRQLGDSAYGEMRTHLAEIGVHGIDREEATDV